MKIQHLRLPKTDEDDDSEEHRGVHRDVCVLPKRKKQKARPKGGRTAEKKIEIKRKDTNGSHPLRTSESDQLATVPWARDHQRVTGEQITSACHWMSSKSPGTYCRGPFE